MKVNGEQLELKTSCTILEFLNQRGCVLDRVAVELNGKIAPKAEYETTTLNDGDSIEIVSFIGGG